MRKMSQREARRWKKLAEQLQRDETNRQRLYGMEYPGIHLVDLVVDTEGWATVNTAIKLGHSIIVKPYNGKLRLFGTRRVGD